MSINIGPPAVEELRPRITVIGVGGAGGNAIANMIAAQIEGVDFVVANTDAQALNNAVTEQRIQLGADITQGLGAGARPEVGRAAAEESLQEIERMLEGSHMCFIAAGMGGGTGTGAAPVIAKVAREKGVLTVGVVTKPFLFEGTRRMRAADAGIEELQKHVDTLIVIPNQNLFLVAKADTTFKEAFSLADEVLQQGVRSITDLMVMPGLINLDFADVRSVMGEMGKAMMGTGEGEGENRALEAAERAIANPLLDGVSMQGAKGVIISIIGGDDMKLLEVDEAANHIRELVDPDANIIWGSAFNPDLKGKIRVSVVATGIEQSAQMAEQAARPSLNFGAARGPGRPAMPPAAAEPANAHQASESAAPQPHEFEPETVSLDSAADDSQFAGAASDAGFGDDDDWGSSATTAVTEATASDDEPLELALDDEVETGEDDDRSARARTGTGGGADAGTDDLLSNASQLHDDNDQAATLAMPGRRRGLVAGGGGEEEVPRAPRPGAGSTLFERMANLSRGGVTSREEEEEDEDGDGGPSISIPRFLGRQNNQ